MRYRGKMRRTIQSACRKLCRFRQDSLKRDAPGSLVQRQDVGPSALDGDGQAFLGKHLEGVPDAAAADAVLPHELGLGRQRLPVRELTLFDARPEDAR
jgi:hypothetical protein